MILFCDFDGTIAQNDVGDTLFKTFANWPECEKAVQRWIRGEISSREYYEVAALTMRVNQEQLDAFCDAQSLTPGFLEFVEFCRQRNWPLIVLSDGLDYYIQRVLLRHGLDLSVFANHLEFISPDRIAVSFPYFEHSCGKCGNGKGCHIRLLTKSDEKIVYIGDGCSDRCGAPLSATSPTVMLPSRGRHLIFCMIWNRPPAIRELQPPRDSRPWSVASPIGGLAATTNGVHSVPRRLRKLFATGA